MREEIKIYIHTATQEKVQEVLNDTTYTLNTNNILLYNDIPVDYYSDKGREITNKLALNNISHETAVQCNQCNEWTTCFYRVNSKNGDYYICDDCIDDYDYCSHCEEYYDSTYEFYDVYDRYNNTISVCENCRCDYYSECANCHEVFHNDNMHYDDYNDECYCDDCYDTRPQNLLYGYHEFNDWQPHHLDNEPEPEFYIGHELEIDNGSNIEQAVEEVQNLGNGICMHDGSLSYNGIEFISHPLSYKYMLSQEDNYRKLFDNLINLGYKSHNTDTCGLHFHITKPADTKVIDRIILFMETYKEEIFTLSRRKSREELNRWSRFLSDKRRNVDTKVIKSLDYIQCNKDTYDRYQALNLTNRNTIEFRFFKGTLKYETFMADFEFVNNLVHFASNLELPIEELTWKKVTSVGKFLPQYIEEHNLQSDTPIIDFSKETLIEFNEEKSNVRTEIDNTIAEVLRRISNKARTRNNTSQKLRKTLEDIAQLNEILKSLQYMLYNIETIDMFAYGRLEELKSDMKYLQERLGNK